MTKRGEQGAVRRIGFEPGVEGESIRGGQDRAIEPGGPERGLFLGARTRYTGTLGIDPQGARLFTDFRLEGARGDSGSFGRAAVDFTASHGIGNGARLNGKMTTSRVVKICLKKHFLKAS